jgi:hypothetical protein
VPIGSPLFSPLPLLYFNGGAWNDWSIPSNVSKRVSNVSNGFIPSFCFLETFQMGLFPPFSLE